MLVYGQFRDQVDIVLRPFNFSIGSCLVSELSRMLTMEILKPNAIPSHTTFQNLAFSGIGFAYLIYRGKRQP